MCIYQSVKSVTHNVPLHVTYSHSPPADWTLGGPIESDIYWLYIVQLGMYLHFILATVFVNARKKDHNVLLVHHVLTIALLSWSYAIR